MKHKLLLFFLSSIFAVSLSAQAATTNSEQCVTPTASQVKALFDQWNNSLKTKNPDAVVANYADDAVLLPTISNKPRTNHQELHDYFVVFLKKSPVGTIDSRVIRMGCNWASDTGLYTFQLTDNGKTEMAKARYSFVYEYINGKWLIVHHHSSLMPEKPAND